MPRREPPQAESRAPRPRRWIEPALCGAALALLALAIVTPWWPALARWPWLESAAAIGAGAAGVLLVARLMRRSDAEAQALARFSQRLREGDVAGALRAVRAEPAAGTFVGHDMAADSGFAREDGEAGGAIASRFPAAALEVEHALGERERRWRARMRLSADWHWETDAEGRVSWVSQDLSSLVKLGVRPADLVGRQFDEVPLFEPPEGGWAAVRERMAARLALRDLVLEVRRRGRPVVWVQLNGRAYHDEQGRFVGYEGVGRDITEQRLAHLRLAESERRHAMMAELAADWYWRSDAGHRIEQVGPALLAMLGDRATQLIGRTRWEAAPDGASAEAWAAHRADLDARRPFRNFEYALRAPGRALRWIAVSGLPRLDPGGQFVGYHGVGRDITPMKRAEQLLVERNEQLERLVAARTAELERSNSDLEAFSRQLAHELRTPISQVAGLADMLKASAWDRLAEPEREWLRLAAQSAREMSHTVTALLELARSASTTLVIEPVDLSALAAAVIEEVPWIERRAPVQWVIEPGLTALCSAALARVALANLLANAAKFTRDVDAPVVRFGRDAESPEGGFVVEDNGAGFDAERAALLFQPFVRLHRSDQFAGTGLGLSIVRRIVERHGGVIAARGVPGQGARFAWRFHAALDGQAQGVGGGAAPTDAGAAADRGAAA